MRPAFSTKRWKSSDSTIICFCSSDNSITENTTNGTRVIYLFIFPGATVDTHFLSSLPSSPLAVWWPVQPLWQSVDHAAECRVVTLNENHDPYASASSPHFPNANLRTLILAKRKKETKNWRKSLLIHQLTLIEQSVKCKITKKERELCKWWVRTYLVHFEMNKKQ